MSDHSPALTRRRFLHTSATTALAAGAAPWLRGATAPEVGDQVRRLLDQPVLQVGFVKESVIVTGLELLKVGKNYFVRARSAEGIEAVTVPNPAMMAKAYPVLLGAVMPAFLQQDARRLEELHVEVYRANSNYKMQGQLFWSAVTAVEQALLELMGRKTGRPLADFFGGAVRREVPVYYASGNRGNTPEAEIAYLQKLRAGSGVRALKFRLGGRMSRNADSLPGRTERLIALARETFGDGMTLYADSNSSYDVPEAIRIGRLLEAHRYGFYEEPCEFDDLWSTKEVADTLTIPVAAGEQEFSLNRWRWVIASRAVDIVQPDLHYGGGFIRATKVARAAAAMGMTLVPHLSGGGLGHLDVVQFASFTPNMGPFQEFKGNASIPVACDTSSIRCEEGVVRCPTGPGFGVTIDPDFLKKAEVMKPTADGAKLE